MNPADVARASRGAEPTQVLRAVPQLPVRRHRVFPRGWRDARDATFTVFLVALTIAAGGAAWFFLRLALERP